MDKKQLKEMRAQLKECYEYGKYLWEQATLFEGDKTDLNYIDYSTRYYQNVDVLEGMMRIYAIAIDVPKGDLASHLSFYLYEAN